MQGKSLDVSELKNHFTNSLFYLMCRPGIASKSPTMYSALSSLYNNFKTQNKKGDWHLNIHPEWELQVEDIRDIGPNGAKALIGGDVEVNAGQISKYTFTLSLLVTGNQNAPASNGQCNVPSCCLDKYKDAERIVRRFHFDTEPGAKRDRPTHHLQYGGKFSGESFRPLHYCLDHQISKPRLPYPPMDFILILNLLVEQFDNLLNLKERNWTHYVKESERILMKPYYAKVYSHFSNKVKKTFFEFLGGLNGF